jgi:hypothetical protein
MYPNDHSRALSLTVRVVRKNGNAQQGCAPVVFVTRSHGFLPNTAEIPAGAGKDFVPRFVWDRRLERPLPIPESQMRQQQCASDACHSKHGPSSSHLE